MRRFSLLSGLAAMSWIAGSAVAAPQPDPFQEHGAPIGGAAPTEAVLYDNVPVGADPVFTTTAAPRTGGADEAIFDGPGALLTSMQFGYQVATGGPAAFDARIRIWDDIDLVTTTGPQFFNLKKDFTVPFTSQVAGAFVTSSIPIPTGGATVLNNPSNLAPLTAPNPPYAGTDCYIQLDFYQPGTTTPVLNNAVTYLFDGTGVNVGRTFADPALGGDGTFNGEVYWRDVNADSNVTADEARFFASAANRANFVLRLEGTIIPEPAPVSLAGLGFAALGLRRRNH